MRKLILTIIYSVLVHTLTLAQCIDFTKLRSDNVTCTYGSFSNPYQHIGIIDDGPDKASSRHTIHKDANETDLRTDNQLHTVPPGELASVRLGNWNTGAQAESITYQYFVDPDETPILVFKYAAVMQDPNHTPQEQPHLKLEILDESNNLVDSYCGAFDFIASSSLGWNQSNDGVLWKDWTAVGLDLSDYKGQTVRIRFTNYDCERGRHYGYAYINISCQKKKIQSLTCGLNNMTTFSGPDGFDYMWYKMEGAKKVDISTNQEITVPTDETTYYCEVSQTGKPTCSFTLDVKANPRLPLANFSYTRRGTCVDTLYFTNLSSVSKDGQTPNNPIEDCDEYIWDLGDGRDVIHAKDITTPIIYRKTGTYTVRLIARLTNGNCEDICEKKIHVHGYDDNHTSEIYDTICENQYLLFGSEKLTKAGKYTRPVGTSYGCDSTIILYLHVNPTYFYEDTVTICENSVYYFHGKQLKRPGIYYDSLITKTGCDSIYKLVLKTNPTYFFEKTVTTCDNQPYYFAGKHLDKTGVYYDSLVSTQGCDSIHKLNLIVYPTYKKDLFVNICRGESYLFNNIEIKNGGVYYDTLQTIHGCDSIIRLLLNVHPTYLFEKTATICENDVYYFHGRQLNKPGVYYDSLIASTGCDSIYKLVLKKSPTYFFEKSASTCEDQPYYFAGKYYNKSGIYYDSLVSTLGCDSIYKLNLTVYPTYYKEIRKTICQGESFYFGGKERRTNGVYTDTLTSINGCDSIIRLVLKVNPTYFFEETKTICRNDVYNFHGRLISEPGIYYDSLIASTGCDSIYKLVLKTNPTYLVERRITICDDQPYYFKGEFLTKSGIYLDTLPTIQGCDSIIRLVLTVNPTYTTNISASICKGESYRFNGRELKSNGTYYDTLQTINGCDSVIRLLLNVNQTYFYEETKTICENDVYNFHGQLISKPGIYYDSLTTSAGCDSIYKLILKTHPTYFFEKTVSTCEDQSYYFAGKHLNRTGVYYDTLVSSNGCDSIHKLNLTVHPTYRKDISANICRGESYMFNGRELKNGGVYYDTLQTINGCDSIIRLRLNVNPTYLFESTETICDNDIYDFRGRKLNKPGVYYDSLIATTGCDSIYKLVLKTNPTFFEEFSAIICADEYYDFAGKHLNKTGIYYDSLISKYGCDSVYKLNLTVHPTYRKDIAANICRGESYMFNGRELKNSGVYYDTLKTINGCDSIFRLALNVNPTYIFEDTITICDNEVYHFRGKQLNRPGIYCDSLIATTGCDSIYKLVLKTNPTFFKETFATICKNDYYNFRGRLLYESGVYYDSLLSVHGCDSVYKLNLTVHPTYLHNISETICHGESFYFGGKELNMTGIYYDTLTTINGCDSVIRLALNVRPTYLFEENVSICKNDTYNFRGQILNKAGTYYDRYETIDGCDSIYKVNLSVNPTYLFETKATICDNHPYHYRNRTFDQTGIYYDSLLTVAGCDSVYKLDLTVNKTYSFTEYANICDYERYKFHSKLLYKTGTYIDTLYTSCGCDSVFTLNLHVQPTLRDTTEATICLGDYYVFGGNMLYTDGIYSDTIYHPETNECEIDMLKLYAIPETRLIEAYVEDACADNSQYQIKYRYEGARPKTYSLYYDANAHMAGFKDVNDAIFTGELYDYIPQYSNDQYLRPDIYNVRIEFDNGTCDPSIHAYDLSFMIKYPSWVIEQNWNDVVALLNQDYNGGYVFKDYDWFVNNQQIVSESKSYIYLPQYLRNGDRVYASLTRQEDDYAICTCPITIEDLSSEMVYEEPVLISISPLKMKIYTPKQSTCTIYDILGHFIYQTKIDIIGENIIDLPSLRSGVYILEFKENDHSITHTFML
ncbi:MAG: T9SS type A sorting domain-containing protein [Paludibacteraceae bacterium]|nr:T9SS type A sorting domain-containing protein [Paludibacteraceae bacterium]